jgi:hypothetical protein
VDGASAARQGHGSVCGCKPGEHPPKAQGGQRQPLTEEGIIVAADEPLRIGEEAVEVEEHRSAPEAKIRGVVGAHVRLEV